MPKAYILTTMFFADDYSLRLTAVDPHPNATYRARQMSGAIPYDDPPSLLPEVMLDDCYDEETMTANFGDGRSTSGEPFCLPRQASIDLGQIYRIEWLWWWPEHDKTKYVPQAWQIDIRKDGVIYAPAFSVSRFEYLFGTAYVVNASCHTYQGEVFLTPVEARFIRFCFDNNSRENFLDEWAVELKLTPVGQNSADFTIQPIGFQHSVLHLQ
jgi:hypothetical protein